MNLQDAATNPAGTPISRQDAEILEGMAALRVSQWWERAGLMESFPADDETVAALCHAVDYVITVEDLVRFIDVAAFTGVSVSEGRRYWSARDIVRLACFLECRRAWNPDSELHASKLTCFEAAFQNLAKTGEDYKLFNDLEMFDLRAIVLMLTESDNRQQREALKVALEIKLASYCISL